MRTAAACVVLAAAVATPGIVLAATSGRGSSEFNVTKSLTGVGYGSGTYSAQPAPIRRQDIPAAKRPPIDPKLRPVARALVKAFARRGMTLVPFPAGKGTAVLFAQGLQMDSCPTMIVLQLPDTAPFKTLPCPSKGVGLARGLKISYTPASTGPTVDAALARLRGNAS